MKTIHKKYPFLDERKTVWSEIARYISKQIGPVNSVLEIGAGYCDFINCFPAKHKFAYEINPEMSNYCSPGITFVCDDAVHLNGILPNTINLVFASNFFEHLSKEQHEILLSRINNVLVTKGLLVLIQPNFILCERNYFDDETHISIFSSDNIKQFLENNGFEIIKLIPGFLPFSMKSKFPKWAILVRLYVNSCFRPKAAQMLVIARKKD